MTTADMVAYLGYFTVGSGGGSGGASAQYTALSVQESVETIGDDDGRADSVKRTWTIESVAYATGGLPANLHTLKAALEADLARREQLVTLVEFGAGARTMAAPPASGLAGAKPGYPRVRVEMHDENSVGPWQYFRVVAETIEPKEYAPLPSGFSLSGFNVVKLTRDRTDTAHIVGGNIVTTYTERGTVRVAAGQNCRHYIDTVIVEPARAQALVDIVDFAPPTYSYSVHDKVEMEYQIATSLPGAGSYGEAAPGLPQGLSDGESVKATRVEREGRRIVRVTGFAVGTTAAVNLFVDNQRPNGPNEILVSEEVSAPRVPDGRVSFSFEAIEGANGGDHQFPGSIRIFRFSETIEEVGGGETLGAAVYHQAPPALWREGAAPYIYRQVTVMEFRGPWADAQITPRMDAENLVTPRPRTRKRAEQGGVRVIEVEQQFAYDTPQDIPDPFEVFQIPGEGS